MLDDSIMEIADLSAFKAPVSPAATYTEEEHLAWIRQTWKNGKERDAYKAKNEVLMEVNDSLMVAFSTLRELVILKDEKDALDEAPADDYDRLYAHYRSRKDKAWQMARALVTPVGGEDVE